MIKNRIKWITIVKHVIYLSNPRLIRGILNQNFIKKIDECKHIKLSSENADKQR